MLRGPTLLMELLLRDLALGPLVWALATLKGSELWAPVLKVVYNGVIMAS